MLDVPHRQGVTDIVAYLDAHPTSNAAPSTPVLSERSINRRSSCSGGLLREADALIGVSTARLLASYPGRAPARHGEPG